MRLQCAGRALLRPNPSPLLPPIKPFSPQPSYHLSRHLPAASHCTLRPPHRHLTTSSRFNHQDSSATGAPNDNNNSSNDGSTSATAADAPPTPKTSTSKPRRPPAQTEISNLLSSLRTQQPPLRQQQQQQQQQPPPPRPSPRPSQSANKIVFGYLQAQAKNTTGSRDALSRLRQPSRGPLSASMGLDNQLLPSSPSSLLPGRGAPAPLRLSPSVGRSVPIDSNTGLDLGRGLNLLNIRCAQNGIRGDANRQRFHERPGLKRKRLRSERWRRKFLKGFKEAVWKVQDMKRKGW
ncbi:MAG: hypothetical protein M1825_003592 [Sarcosagium campestre]|nr:MAG: hypothetical protein M1825_003592 [Sarcosagium campestre]